MATSKKLSKKEFFEVKVPITAAKIKLYAASKDDLLGKVIKLDLTRSLRGKSFELSLRVKKDGENLEGDPYSLVLLGSYIRRVFRKGIDYVEDSFVAECKDAKVIIKPFLMTRNKVSRAVRRELRNETKKFLETHLKTRSTKDVFTELTTNKLQKELSLKLKKIYPLALCEIRHFEILPEKK